MRRTLSRLFSGLLRPLFKANPEVLKALDRAREQEAPFQMEIPLEGKRCHHLYLHLVSHDSREVTLRCQSAFFMVPQAWKGRSFLFKALIQKDPSKPPLLHKFRTRVEEALKDKKTLRLAMPRDVAAVEQRRNVRLKPKTEHLPGLVVWGVHKNQEQARGVSLRHHLILEMEPGDPDAFKTIKNISAGGIRLALAPQDAARNARWLEPGCRLIVQLFFRAVDSLKASRHMFVARVCNERSECVNRPERGIEFLAAREEGPPPSWRPLEKNGCERLARAIHAMQVLYFSQAKARLAVREGAISASPGQEKASRRRA